jgi:hypothetical protein
VLKVGDKVKIISSIHSELIGTKAVITKAVKPIGEEPYYRLDIIAGYWTDDKLERI